MEANLRKVLDVSLDFITMINRQYQYEFVNEAYCRQFERTRESIEGKTVAELWGESRFQDKIRPHLDRCFAGKDDHDVDRFQFGEGFKYVQVTYTPLTTEGTVTHVLVYSRDLTTMKELEAKMQNIEYKDPITGLLNRKSFDIVLEMELEKARTSETDKRRAVMFIHLKNFQHLDVEYGAKISDVLLESIGSRIKEAIRAKDYVFRMDGQRFAVILTEVAENSMIEQMADAIAGAVAVPYQHQNAPIHVGSAIGFSIFPDNGAVAEDLVRFALSALGQAQNMVRPIAAFNPKIHGEALRKESLRADIRTGLVAEQFAPFYQPIVDDQGRLAGAEALIRWTHPRLGPISPTEFIPIAEESGDCPMIDRWMLFRVLKALEAWRDKMENCYISVNISAANFAAGTAVEDIAKALQGKNIAPHTLKVEVTESQPMFNVGAAVRKIAALEALGVEVLIDDFGSGYSSLAYLKQLPAQVIKIDKTFVDAIAENADDRDFLAGMIHMIHTQDRKIVVEGVETKEQWALLKKMGVTLFQGYLFSKPLPQGAFEELLTKSRPLA